MDTINITDECDGLKIYHFNDCNETSPEEVKQSRGLIKDGEIVVCKSFPFTPEIRSDNEELIEKYIIPLEGNKAFISQEGSLLRVWYYGGKWRLSTHRKMDAFCSRWGSETSYGAYFINLLLKQYGEEIKENESIFDKYTSSLNQELVYIFLLRSCNENRVVCNKYNDPSLFIIGAFQKPQEVEQLLSQWTFIPGSSLTETLFSPVPEIKYNTIQELIEYVKTLDIYESQGIVIITSKGESIKLVNHNYDDLFKLRGNVPNVVLRYIQLRNGDKDQLNTYKKLYPEFSTTFNDVESSFQSIISNLHRNYVSRFIKRQVAVVPPEQYSIIRELHDIHLVDRTVIITQQKVRSYFNTLESQRLWTLYKKYVVRREVGGNGNSVSDEDRERVLQKNNNSV